MGGLDADAAEAVALAHDLGHPPFGHVAEVELARLVRAAGVRDGFEGNAQSFRIVTKLASSDALDESENPIPGLNWTRNCLKGLLKYPWGFEPTEKKWGYYETEKDIFDWVRDGLSSRRRSLLAEIMDWADDITYAIHDLLDFFCAQTIPIDRIGRDSTERDNFLGGIFSRHADWARSRGSYEEALDAVIESFPFDSEKRYTDSLADRSLLYGFATNLIRPFVNAIALKEPTSHSEVVVEIEQPARRQVDVLKEFTWHYIILNPELALPQQGQRRAIRSVFRKLLLAAHRGDDYLFPQLVRDRLDEARAATTHGEKRHQIVRVVTDHIAETTEREIIRTYRRLEGTE
jgi:dGTPase